MAIAIRLITVEVDLPKSPVELGRAIDAQLRQQGEPLRWAITAIDRERCKAWVEAVITVQDPLFATVTV